MLQAGCLWCWVRPDPECTPGTWVRSVRRCDSGFRAVSLVLTWRTHSLEPAKYIASVFLDAHCRKKKRKASFDWVLEHQNKTFSERAHLAIYISWEQQFVENVFKGENYGMKCSGDRWLPSSCWGTGWHLYPDPGILFPPAWVLPPQSRTYSLMPPVGQCRPPSVHLHKSTGNWCRNGKSARIQSGSVFWEHISASSDLRHDPAEPGLWSVEPKSWAFGTSLFEFWPNLGSEQPHCNPANVICVFWKSTL